MRAMPTPSDRRRGTVSHAGKGGTSQALRATAPWWVSRPHSILAGLSLLVLFPTMALGEHRIVERTSLLQADVTPARTPSIYIGSVMAMLATFEDAGILPPEGTSQANRIIKAVIQFQSAFLKSNHPAIRQFFTEAHRTKLGPRADEVEASFRQSGWSADTFDAVITAGRADTVWNTDGLSDGFQEFNIGKQDFDILAQLYQQSTTAFSTQGKTFQEVYAQRRREMPGGKSE